MKHKNAFWFSLALVACMAPAPILAQGPQDRGIKTPPPVASQNSKVQPPPPYMDPNGKDAQRTIPGAFRLTYILTEMDGDKRVGSQRYQLVLDADAPPARLDLQTTVHIPYGQSTFSDDIGIHFFARLRQFANGIELNMEIRDSSLAPETDHQTTLLTRPAVRQSNLNTTVLLRENKPVMIGNLDIPGSTHNLQVQVELTRVP